MRCVIGKDLQLCVQVKGEEDCRCKATGSMAARKRLEPTLNVRVCSRVELEGAYARSTSRGFPWQSVALKRYIF
jgi:hypothetical protein